MFFTFVNEFSYIALYQNSVRLREIEKSATLISTPFSTWGIVGTGNLIVSIDDTPDQDRSFTVSDFGGTNFNALVLNDWVIAFNNKYAIVYSDVMIIDEDGKKSFSKQSGLFKKQLFLNQMPHQAIFFNAELTQNIPYDTTFRVAADLDLLVKIYLKYGLEAFKIVEQPLVHYALGGYSAQHYSTLVKERYQVILK